MRYRSRRYVSGEGDIVIVGTNGSGSGDSGGDIRSGYSDDDSGGSGSDCDNYGSCGGSPQLVTAMVMIHHDW